MRGLLQVLMFAILLTTPLLGCGESAPDTEDVIGKAKDAIEKVQTYRIEGEATVTQDEKTTQSNFQMEFVSPDRIRTTTMEENGSSESIRIGQTEYNRHLDNDEWQVRQWPESFPSYNMAVIMVKSLDVLVGLVRLADEKIDGVDCFHYKGSEDMEGRVDKRKAELDPSQRGYEEQLRLLEAQRQSQSEVEFWIGKENYLLRCLEQHNDIVFIEDMGKDTEREAHTTMTVKYTFYDFNQPIQVEPPVAESVKGVNLVATMTSTGNGGDDLEHYQVNYKITISNRGVETARDVRTFVDTPATSQGLQTIEAEPGQKPINLGPDESETYLVSWEYNLATSSKEKFIELIRQNVLRATWTDKNGQQQEDILLDGR